ncbi:MAG: hypothetical protein WAR83_01685, partial [Flavobacteriales bacterium]
AYGHNTTFIHGVGKKKHIQYLKFLNGPARDSILNVVQTDLMYDESIIRVGKQVGCEEVIVENDTLMLVTYRLPQMTRRYRTYLERAAVRVPN